MTRQRQLIYELVTSSPQHRTAEEIFLLAREKMPSLARGTVYRNLGVLTEEGAIGKLEMPGAPARYDRVSRPHPHLVCRRCGAVEDFCLEEDAEAAMFSRLHTEITGYDLKVFHICPACQKE